MADTLQQPEAEQQHREEQQRTEKEGTVDSAAGAVPSAEQRIHYSLRAGGTLVPCGSEVLTLRYSPDGKYLVAGCGSGQLRVFNTLTGASLTHEGSSSRHVDDDTIAGGASAWAKKLSLRASRGPDDTLAADQVQSRDSDSLKKTALSPRPVLTTRSSTLHDALEMSLPCTSLAFRPDGDGTLTANVLVAGFADGTLQHWHAPSGKRLSKMAVGGSDPNTSASAGVFGLEILSVAYAHSGDCFSAGGSDGKVRLFSEETRQALAVLQPGIGFQFGAAQNGGHSGRVFAQKFSREDPNMLVSAGWDNCVHVWDIRQARSTLTIFGPHVCGDACDMTQQTLVTGSCRNTEQMQFWDMRTGKVMEQISWGSLTAGGGGDTACRLYAAGFSHTADADGRFVAAGGGDGANEARVYQLANGRLASDSLIGSLLGLSAGVLTLDFAPTGDKMAIGLGNGTIHMVDIVVSPSQSSHEKIIMF